MRSAYSPPRYQVKLGVADGSSSCESLYSYVYGDDGSTVVTNMTWVNVDTGEYYKHNIIYADHWSWGCWFLWRHDADASGNYPSRAADFNAFFGSGSRVKLGMREVETNNCNPKRDRFTGYDADSTYCQPMSDDFDDEPHLVLHSGWVGLVVDASVANGNFLPKFGAVPESAGNATTAEIYAALPTSFLNVTMVTSSGAVYKLDKQATDFAVVSAARQGIVTSHILITDLVWVAHGVGIATIDIDPPQWWLEVEVRGTTMSVQLGWDELAVGGGCAVCEDATVDITLTMEDQVLTNTVEYVASEQFDTLSLVFEAGGKSFATLDQEIDVTSETCDVNYRTEKNDVFLEVPVATTKCSYNVPCSPLIELDFTVSNPNSEDGVVHLTFSRNFQSRITSLTQSITSAEVRWPMHN